MKKISIRNHAVAYAALCFLLTGCPTSDGAVESSDDMGQRPADLGCYTKPRTHVELLNACTTAQSVDKHPVLPLLNRDGTLPPLP